MRHVLDDAGHRPAKELLVLVVHRHDDEQLGATRGVAENLAEREPVEFEVVGVTGGRITHVRVLAVCAGGAHVEELGWLGTLWGGHGRVYVVKSLILAEKERR